jgi:hypothetical protein
MSLYLAASKHSRWVSWIEEDAIPRWESLNGALFVVPFCHARTALEILTLVLRVFIAATGLSLAMVPFALCAYEYSNISRLGPLTCLSLRTLSLTRMSEENAYELNMIFPLSVRCASSLATRGSNVTARRPACDRTAR